MRVKSRAPPSGRQFLLLHFQGRQVGGKLKVVYRVSTSKPPLIFTNFKIPTTCNQWQLQYINGKIIWSLSVFFCFIRKSFNKISSSKDRSILGCLSISEPVFGFLYAYKTKTCRLILQMLVRNSLQPKLKQAACSELTQISPLDRPKSRKARQRPLETKKGTFSAVFHKKGYFYHNFSQFEKGSVPGKIPSTFATGRFWLQNWVLASGVTNGGGRFTPQAPNFSFESPESLVKGLQSMIF